MIESIKCIEFIGLPGCGKTSVANHLIEQLNNHSGLQVANRSNIDLWLLKTSRWIKLYWMLKNPIRLVKNWYAALRVCTELGPLRLDIIARALKLPIIDIFTQQYLKNHRDLICVIDQGSLQNIWSIMAHSKKLPERSIRTLAKYQLCRRYSTMYVYVTCSAELASQRITMRTHGNSRFEALADQQRQKILENSTRSLSIIIQSIIAENQLLFTVNAEQPIEEKSKLIIEQYESTRKFN